MDLNIFEIPTTVALSIMALVGYVFAYCQRLKKAMLNMQRDLAQARMAVSELEKVVSAIHAIRQNILPSEKVAEPAWKPEH